MTAANMSTKKAHTICKILEGIGICLLIPSQSGVYKASIKAGGKIKEHFMKTLKNKNWNLHFDGKHIKKTEYQVVVLKMKIVKLNKRSWNGPMQKMNEYSME